MYKNATQNNSEEIKSKISSFANTFDDIPGVIIVHNLVTWSIVYMNNVGLKQLGLTLKEVCSLSTEEYQKRYFNTEDARVYVPKLEALILANDFDDTVSFYQQVRFTEEGKWHWHLSSIKIIMRSADAKPLLVMTISIPVDSMHHMATKAERILEENEFLRKNFDKFSKLSQREKVVLAEIALGKSSIEIAEKLCISSTTVDTHRRNIRTKLNTKSSFDISNYARAFDLI